MAASLSLVSAPNGGEGAVSGDTLAVVYADGSMDDVEKDVRLRSRQPWFALPLLSHLLVCDRSGSPLFNVHA